MSEAEQYWDERAAKLRRLMGFCPLTPAEAEEALRKAKNRTSSEEEIDALVEAVSRGEIPIPEEPEDASPFDWSPEKDFSALESDAVLFRNKGDGSQEPDKDEEDLLEELLNDDEEDDGDGLEG
ncbi:MAG: hypothetical protein JSS02_06510 [Planctomycetes bacterium]|nr:hypothetical protein [Planctomycetota bacterium]